MVNRWTGGGEAIGSMLTVANLANNAIEVIHDLSHHPFLETLNLSGNQLSKISGFSSLRHLKVNMSIELEIMSEF